MWLLVNTPNRNMWCKDDDMFYHLYNIFTIKIYYFYCAETTYTKVTQKLISRSVTHPLLGSLWLCYHSLFYVYLVIYSKGIYIYSIWIWIYTNQFGSNMPSIRRKSKLPKRWIRNWIGVLSKYVFRYVDIICLKRGECFSNILICHESNHLPIPVNWNMLFMRIHILASVYLTNDIIYLRYEMCWRHAIYNRQYLVMAINLHCSVKKR